MEPMTDGERLGLDPERDLALRRLLPAPRAAIWRAWSEPELVAGWWIPSPLHSRVERLELSPGGSFVTSMSEDGEHWVPHTDDVFLAVEAERRIVFTNAVDAGLRPAAPAPVAITAEVLLNDHAEGTDYLVIVRHADAAARALHEELGFHEGWGAVAEQLGAVAASLT